jgi:DNA repair exonuclease SbcCD nuclease subunit
MTRDIIVVHSSDLHLEAEPTAPEWGGDGTRNLTMVLEAARRVEADLVLLAGDTFDSHRQPDDFIDRVAQMLGAAPVPVVILPGNHDPIVLEAVYHRMRARLGNLHVLGVTHEEALIFPGLDLEVWGRAHRGYGDMVPFEHVRARRTRWQLAMAHGHYHPEPDRSTRLRPAWLIGDAELAATQSDYIALGHWNRAVSVGHAELRAYYSGSPDYAGTVNVVRLTSQGKVLVVREPVDDRDDRSAPQ